MLIMYLFAWGTSRPKMNIVNVLLQRLSVYQRSTMVSIYMRLDSLRQFNCNRVDDAERIQSEGKQQLLFYVITSWYILQNLSNKSGEWGTRFDKRRMRFYLI